MDNMDNTHVDEVNNDALAQQTKKENPTEKNVFSQTVKIIGFILGLFVLGNVIGSLTNIQRVDNFQTHHNTTSTTFTETTAQVTTALPETTLATETTTEAETTAQTTTVPTTTKPETTKDTIPDTKKEIVALFNSSANKIKKKAKKVTRNYEDLRHDEELSDYPAILNALGLPLINSYLVKNDVPEEYTEDAIKENYPVKGKEWVSKLKTDDVAKAKCIEKNGNYEIELTLLYCKDPAENKGVAAVFDPVTLEEIQSKAFVVKSCSVEYYDCIIRCTVEKDSGNMIWAKYTQPMILNLTTQGLTERQAVFAMTIESEYVIEY